MQHIFPCDCQHCSSAINAVKAVSTLNRYFQSLPVGELVDGSVILDWELSLQHHYQAAFTQTVLADKQAAEFALLNGDWTRSVEVAQHGIDGISLYIRAHNTNVREDKRIPLIDQAASEKTPDDRDHTEKQLRDWLRKRVPDMKARYFHLDEYNYNLPGWGGPCDERIIPRSAQLL